jgi:hypothetical protein
MRDVAFAQCAARLAAMFAPFSLIGREFCCTLKAQVIAVGGLLHIQKLL